VIDVSFLADFPMTEGEIGHEEEAVLKQAELGLPVADLVRQTGITEQTFYRWKKQYAGLEST
jgi:hypothetical protein